MTDSPLYDAESGCYGLNGHGGGYRNERIVRIDEGADRCDVWHNVINDKYVSDKIYDNIVNKIKSACMGKLVVNGNYQVLVSDQIGRASCRERVCLYV